MSRTIIIGDVHGCKAELEELILGLSLVPSDKVIFVGDLVLLTLLEGSVAK